MDQEMKPTYTAYKRDASLEKLLYTLPDKNKILKFAQNAAAIKI